jgi:hypothetical protein
MKYTLRLGYSDDAPVAEHEANAGTLSIGSEVLVNGEPWVIAEIGVTDPDRHTDFICARAAPALVIHLHGDDYAELYTSELAILRRQLRRMHEGGPAEEVIGRVLENDQRDALTDAMLQAIADAIHALEISRDPTDHLIAVERAIRRQLERTSAEP